MLGTVFRQRSWFCLELIGLLGFMLRDRGCSVLCEVAVFTPVELLLTQVEEFIFVPLCFIASIFVSVVQGRASAQRMPGLLVVTGP